MPALSSYDYAIIRIVPHVERGECINVGVILYCQTRRFLDVLISLDIDRLLALAPDSDLEDVQHQLASIESICKGGKEAGPIGALSLSERFHWLVAPRSTIIQTSPVHSGLSADPRTTLHHLLEAMVLLAQPQKTRLSNS
ncbi:MAG TPA: DUF3037 domain-containing protein [Ktedonobacteraceae bacterium]|nr:DUF3037 domain-containing protein [Ktedonobacteraceae bacterium]